MEEKQDDSLAGSSPSMWMRRSQSSFDRDKKTRSHLESFLAEVKNTGVTSEQGTVLCNCETASTNDISHLYPWLHVSDTLLDIKVWLRRAGSRQHGQGPSSIPTPPPPLLSGSLGRHGNLEAAGVHDMRVVQGTYCLVESVLSERDIAPAGEQLVILLGFKTTNNVETEQGWKKSRESQTWRDWTGITDLYKAVSNQNYIEVKKVEFLEAHSVSSWQSRGVFQYLVLLHTQASGTRAKVTLLDAVERFRAGNMSGYVTDRKSVV